MINRTYDTRCLADKLQAEIITAGLPVYPNAGARFYYVNVDIVAGSYVTTVVVYDDLSGGEGTTIDGVVAAHIPIVDHTGPLPVQETEIFAALAIRDTSEHISSVSENIGYRVKTIIIKNELNQTVTLQCQGSRDSSDWFNITDSFNVSSATTIHQSCETYFPYLRALATCPTAPTTGGLSMWIEKMGV